MKNETIQKADTVIANTYNRFPVVLTKGSGCSVWDDQGNRYTDFLAGIAVCNLGHAHPEVVKALSSQAENLFHVSNLFYTQPQTELAAWLVNHSFADRVFFCNSGAEANEAAIKLARKYFQIKGQPHRFHIISMEKSFHGRTMATLSATGQDKIREGFDPVLKGFEFVPFNDLDAVKMRIGPETCAVMLEPVQGEGGVRVPDEGYLEGLRKLCDDAGILLIFDEIQTGMGRTGKLFAYQHTKITPDIMTLAKALGNGLPIGAMLAKDSIAGAFVPGSHASTFGGTPVVTAAALAVLKTMDTRKIVDHCAEVGAYFLDRLRTLKAKHKAIVDVRGKGLLVGMKLDTDGDAVVKACMAKGFIINCIQGRILRFVPPLIVTKNEIDALVESLDMIFSEMASK